MISLRTFIAGFLTIAIVHIVVTCSENDSGTDPTVEPTVDVNKIHEGAKRVEDAFRTGTPDAVNAVLTDEGQAQYGNDLAGIAEQMPAFADAIVSRRLVTYTECYAEYAYEAKGRTMSFAMAAQDENDWKLMRF